MKTVPTQAPHNAAEKLGGSDRRTIDALFRHPVAHNLGWSDVIALFEKLGTVERKANDEFVLEVNAQRHVMRRPHGKDLTATEVVDLRKFLTQAEVFADREEKPAVSAAPAEPNLLVMMDHHGAKLYDVDVTAQDASQIKPYDPHHFQHHLTHKDQSREEGQRTAEDSGYYEQISQALAAAGKIVVIGHGTGKSDAAGHLLEYLKSHHSETNRRVVGALTADISSVTTPQLLEMAREALR